MSELQRKYTKQVTKIPGGTDPDGGGPMIWYWHQHFDYNGKSAEMWIPEEIAKNMAPHELISWAVENALSAIDTHEVSE